MPVSPYIHTSYFTSWCWFIFWNIFSTHTHTTSHPPAPSAHLPPNSLLGLLSCLWRIQICLCRCLFMCVYVYGLLRWHNGKEPACKCRRHGFDLWVGKIPWRRKWQPAPVFHAWRIPWTEEPRGLQSMGSQRVRHDWEHTHTCVYVCINIDICINKYIVHVCV